MHLKVKVGVVGAGIMGLRHAHLYRAHPQAHLIGITDPNPNARARAASELDIPVHTDYSALLGQVEAVSIASPASYHAAQAQTFLTAGIHVLVEKPVATNWAETQALVAAARQQGVILQVGYPLRFHPVIQSITRRLPPPDYIEARRLTTISRIQDVGVILDLMVHDLDIILRWFGEYSSGWTVDRQPNGQPEDYAQAKLKFPSGRQAQLTASRIALRPERSLSISYPDTILHLDFTQPEKTIWSRQRLTRPASQIVFRNPNLLQSELNYFIQSIGREVEAGSELEHDLNVQRLALSLTTD